MYVNIWTEWEFLNFFENFLSNGIEVQLVSSAYRLQGKYEHPKETENGTTCLNWQVIDN